MTASAPTPRTDVTPRRSLLRVRQDVGSVAALILSTLSFLIPLAIWSAVSYIPWIWHPDVKLDIAPERAGGEAVYTAGDHVSRAFFPTYVAAIQSDNLLIEKKIAKHEATPGTRRSNVKVLRSIAPMAVKHGWIPSIQEQDDKALQEIWSRIAADAIPDAASIISTENLAIIRRNVALLGEAESASNGDVALLKLVPQGRPANPVYLPAPHEVAMAAWQDFNPHKESDGLSLWQRYGHSLRIILYGFLLSCVVGVPLGILCGVYDAISKLFEPFIDFFRYMPAPTFGTLMVAVLLAADAPKIALVFIGTVFQMVLVIAKTTRLMDSALLEAAQTLGARPRQLVTAVVIPSILPHLYNDLRILLGWAWTWLVIAELIGVKSGLTEFIETQGRFRNFERVYPVIITIGLTGFICDQCLAWLHTRLFPWAAETKPSLFGDALRRMRSVIASWLQCLKPAPKLQG